MTIGDFRRALVPVLLAWPAAAGMIPLSLDSSVSTPTDAGFFADGTVLAITVTGQVSLGVGFSTNPDGSPTGSYESPYGYFNPNGATYDIAPPSWDSAYIASDPCGNDWSSGYADEGVITQSLSTPGAIPLGSVAGLFSSSAGSPFSTGCNLNWFMAATNNNGIYGGTFTVPAGGAYFWLVVPDTYYLNNVGSFEVSVDPVPEPSVAWLTLAGLLVLMGFIPFIRGKHAVSSRMPLKRNT